MILPRFSVFQKFSKIGHSDEDDCQPDDIERIDAAVIHSGCNDGENKPDNCPDYKNLKLIHRQIPFHLKYG